MHRGIAAQILTAQVLHIPRVLVRGMPPLKLLDKEIEVPELRRQDKKNRQNSTSDLPPGLVAEYEGKIARHYDDAMWLYQQLLRQRCGKRVCSLRPTL
jgi:thymidylate synthase (FAD)